MAVSAAMEARPERSGKTRCSRSIIAVSATDMTAVTVNSRRRGEVLVFDPKSAPQDYC